MKKKREKKDLGDIQMVPLLHEELCSEIKETAKKLMYLSEKVFQVGQQMYSPEGNITLQAAASLANLLSPLVRVEEFINSTNAKLMYQQLDELLVKNGAQKHQEM